MASPPFIKDFIFQFLLTTFDSVMKSLFTLDLFKSKLKKKKTKTKKLGIPPSFSTLPWLDMRPRTAIAISISAWKCSQHHPDKSRDKGIQKKWSWSFNPKDYCISGLIHIWTNSFSLLSRKKYAHKKRNLYLLGKAFSSCSIL